MAHIGPIVISARKSRRTSRPATRTDCAIQTAADDFSSGSIADGHERQFAPGMRLRRRRPGRTLCCQPAADCRLPYSASPTLAPRRPALEVDQDLISLCQFARPEIEFRAINSGRPVSTADTGRPWACGRGKYQQDRGEPPESHASSRRQASARRLVGRSCQSQS